MIMLIVIGALRWMILFILVAILFVPILGTIGMAPMEKEVGHGQDGTIAIATQTIVIQLGSLVDHYRLSLY